VVGRLTQGANRPASSEGKRKGDAILTTLGRSEDLWEIFTVAKLLRGLETPSRTLTMLDLCVIRSAIVPCIALQG